MSERQDATRYAALALSSCPPSCPWYLWHLSDVWHPLIHSGTLSSNARCYCNLVKAKPQMLSKVRESMRPEHFIPSVVLPLYIYGLCNSPYHLHTHNTAMYPCSGLYLHLLHRSLVPTHSLTNPDSICTSRHIMSHYGCLTSGHRSLRIVMHPITITSSMTKAQSMSQCKWRSTSNLT